MKLSVIVPTRNEAPNVQQLIGRATEACRDIDAELVFVDDSTDNTPEVIAAAAASQPMRIRVIHREAPTGGLSGAVVDGVRSSAAEFCMVMSGDLQHPPELIPVLLAKLEGNDADVVVASRYGARGTSDDDANYGARPADGGKEDGGNDGGGGAATWSRRVVSVGATRITLALFPLRLRGCSDPMTGYFGLRRSAIECSALRPSGFKILLEILARHHLTVSEVPFTPGPRTAGRSKAGVGQGLRFLRQLGELRAGTAMLFAGVGAVGAVLNLLIMAFLLSTGTNFVAAAIVAAELTIVSNFLMQENIVFGTLPQKANGFRTRFAQSFWFNNLEALARLPVLMLAVNVLVIDAVLAQAATLAAAFVVRYLYHSRIVYSARPAPAPGAAPAANGGLRFTRGRMRLRRQLPRSLGTGRPGT
ncbi:glycosyltransferase [Arthrobacter sp. 2MCAF15]|uniref:glycosyltransferase n=1 Tax=Arthrobacter sp. 2MCAF15 TaxID=3232984 RepID=UPI003F92BAF4